MPFYVAASSDGGGTSSGNGSGSGSSGSGSGSGGNTSSSGDTESTSADLEGAVPAAGPIEPFVELQYIKDGLIYDASYIHKFKGPSLHSMIDSLNQLANTVTDLQSVIVNLVEECTETRKVVDTVWSYTKRCCDAEEVHITDYPKGNMWDGSGVLEEGIEPYILASEVSTGE